MGLELKLKELLKLSLLREVYFLFPTFALTLCLPSQEFFCFFWEFVRHSTFYWGEEDESIERGICVPSKLHRKMKAIQRENRWEEKQDVQDR